MSEPKSYFVVSVYPDGYVAKEHVWTKDIGRYAESKKVGFLPVAEVFTYECPGEWDCDCTLLVQTCEECGETIREVGLVMPFNLDGTVHSQHFDFSRVVVTVVN